MIEAASTAPPRGALKIAPIPEPIPNDTARRPSSSDRFNSRVSSEPKPAEICAAGPSRPPDPPDPIVSALAINLTTTARPRIDRGSFSAASIALSVPWPWASGANFATMNADTKAPPKAINTIAHGRLNPGDPDPPPSPMDCGC